MINENWIFIILDHRLHHQIYDKNLLDSDIRKINSGVGAVFQLAECLPNVYEGLGFDPQDHENQAEWHTPGVPVCGG